MREDVTFDPRPDLDLFIPAVFESLFITIKPSNITVGVIYRSPLTEISDFLCYYKDKIISLKGLCDKFILLAIGDFNIDLLLRASRRTNLLIIILSTIAFP